MMNGICSEQDVELIQVSITKYSETVKVGIGLKQDDDSSSLIISKIAPDGLLATSNLKAGFRIVSIQGMRGLGALEAASVIKNTVGLLTIVADKTGLVVTLVKKESADQKLGIRLRQEEEGCGLMVQSLAPDGLLAISDLKPGYKLISIDNVLCDHEWTAQRVSEQLKQSHGLVTIVAVRHTAEPETFTLTLQRKSKSVQGAPLVFHVYLNGQKVGEMSNRKEPTLTVRGTVKDIVSIRAWLNPGLSFRVVKAGNLQLRVKFTATYGVRICNTFNPDAEAGAFDNWGTPVGMDPNKFTGGERAMIALAVGGLAY
uniref:PDZ domain-containing protein n=1 Tax=Amphora coffeiformis TaxID=265554 RepID=A0A7S3KZ40_9STRA|mmetsp:Transcript_545/g.1157  ORF Transcript_545/g.1157 Transcript_545/m.1157 type:complete len:314 (+) Transcript_545:365-1306(+)|eukprot:scaffold46773_cov168-Amphora_coffeaeformis.AAC.1